MKSRPILALALSLALAACHKKAEPPPPPPPAAPFTFTQQTPAGAVSLTLPRAVGPLRILHRRLYDSGKRQLTEFLAQAVTDRAYTEHGDAPAAPYTRTSAWRITADTPRLIGLAEDWTVYTGGAYPGHGTTAMIWDKAAEGEVPPSQLLRPGADMARLDTLLCELVRQAKVARMGAQALQGEFWTCPTWSTSRAALAPSTQPGKIGGLTFLFDPHVIGAFAEGDYAVTIPQAAIRSELSAVYLPQFAGAPAPQTAAKPAPKPMPSPPRAP